MSTIILAIETSSELASVALLCNEKIVMRETVGVRTHSQTVLPMVQDLCAHMGVSLSQCDAIAFGCGPGSFTGVRTACGIAQGLAFGLDKPMVPVTTLQAMAQSCKNAHGAAEVLAVLDARMGEVYWAQYRWMAGLDAWQTVTAPALSSPADLFVVGSVMACGNGLHTLGNDTPAMATKMDLAIMPHATCVAQLAQRAFAAGQVILAEDASPLYLRNKIALTTHERLAKAAT